MATLLWFVCLFCNYPQHLIPLFLIRVYSSLAVITHNLHRHLYSFTNLACSNIQNIIKLKCNKKVDNKFDSFYIK